MTATNKLVNKVVEAALRDVRTHIIERMEELRHTAPDSPYVRGMLSGLEEADVMLHIASQESNDATQ
jgi:hypothetical protein